MITSYKKSSVEASAWVADSGQKKLTAYS